MSTMRVSELWNVYSKAVALQEQINKYRADCDSKNEDLEEDAIALLDALNSVANEIKATVWPHLDNELRKDSR
jgi:hypothetical protein